MTNITRLLSIFCLDFPWTEDQQFHPTFLESLPRFAQLFSFFPLKVEHKKNKQTTLETKVNGRRGKIM